MLILKFKVGIDVELEDGTILYVDDYMFVLEKLCSYVYCFDIVYLLLIVEVISGVSCLYYEVIFFEVMREWVKVIFYFIVLDVVWIVMVVGVGKLLLGYLSVCYLEIQGYFDEVVLIFFNVIVVEDGDVFNVQC